MAHVKVFVRWGVGGGGGVDRDYCSEFFSWVIINPVQGPLAVPGPDYKVQGCFFIRTSHVCASRSGATATGRRPPALTAPTCAQLSAIDGETQQRVNCWLSNAGSRLLFLFSLQNGQHTSLFLRRSENHRLAA